MRQLPTLYNDAWALGIVGEFVNAMLVKPPGAYPSFKLVAALDGHLPLPGYRGS